MTGAPGVSDDPQSFLSALVESVARVLPDAVSSGVLTVDRDRSLGDRLAGRPGSITGLRLAAPDERFSLRIAPGPSWKVEIARVSGGVVIARRVPALSVWLSSFAGQIAALAADRAGEAAATLPALRALGIQPSRADIRVGDETIPTDLRGLPARLEGRIPEEAVRSIAAIGELLIDTLPRVVDSVETAFIVRRTATAYLPDTLRSYLSLPRDWAETHVFPDGSTPQAEFVEQVATIERAVRRMHDSAVEQDAAALLDNGRFLSARFTLSGLDEPPQ